MAPHLSTSLLYYIHTLYSSPLQPKNEFTFYNSLIPQLNSYCKIAFFVQQIVIVVRLVYLYTEYRCHLFTIQSEIPKVYLVISIQQSRYVPIFVARYLCSINLNCKRKHGKFSHLEVNFLASNQASCLTNQLFDQMSKIEMHSYAT